MWTMRRSFSSLSLLFLTNVVARKVMQTKIASFFTWSLDRKNEPLQKNRTAEQGFSMVCRGVFSSSRNRPWQNAIVSHHWSIRTLTNERKEDLGLVGMSSLLRAAWWLSTGDSLDTRLAEIEWVRIHVRTETVDSCRLIKRESSEGCDGSISVWRSMLSTGMDSVPICFVSITEALMCLFTVHELEGLGISIRLPKFLRLPMYSHGWRILGVRRFPLLKGGEWRADVRSLVFHSNKWLWGQRRSLLPVDSFVWQGDVCKSSKKHFEDEEEQRERERTNLWFVVMLETLEEIRFLRREIRRDVQQWSSDFDRSIEWTNETNSEIQTNLFVFKAKRPTWRNVCRWGCCPERRQLTAVEVATFRLFDDGRDLCFNFRPQRRWSERKDFSSSSSSSSSAWSVDCCSSQDEKVACSSTHPFLCLFEFDCLEWIVDDSNREIFIAQFLDRRSKWRRRIGLVCRFSVIEKDFVALFSGPSNDLFERKNSIRFAFEEIGVERERIGEQIHSPLDENLFWPRRRTISIQQQRTTEFPRRSNLLSTLPNNQSFIGEHLFEELFQFLILFTRRPLKKPFDQRRIKKRKNERRADKWSDVLVRERNSSPTMFHLWTSNVCLLFFLFTEQIRSGATTSEFSSSSPLSRSSSKGPPRRIDGPWYSLKQPEEHFLCHRSAART